MKNISLFIALSLIAPSWIFAQPSVTFSETRFNFGVINGSDRVLEHSFAFLNESGELLSIDSVKSDCRCAIPFFSREGIAPGDSGIVRVDVNITNYPGPLEKHVYVFFSGFNAPVPLTIEGLVRPVETYRFTHAQGNFSTESRYWHMGNMPPEGSISRIFPVKNEGNKPLAFIKNELSPPFVSLSFTEDTIAPGAIGYVQVTYLPRMKNKYGYFVDQIDMQTNDKPNPVKHIMLTATIEPYADPAADQQGKLEVVSSRHIFPEVNEGDTTSLQVTLKNSGTAPLKIYQVSSNCSCIWATNLPEVIPVDSLQEVTVYFDTSERKGREFKQLILFTSDPTNPSTSILLQGRVEERPVE